MAEADRLYGCAHTLDLVSDGCRFTRDKLVQLKDRFGQLDQQTQFYLAWTAIVSLALLWMMDVGTLLLLGLGLCIGGAAQAVLSARYPELYAAPDASAAEQQALTGGLAANAGEGVAGQLRALDALGASRVLDPSQVALAKQQVLTSVSRDSGARTGGGAAASAHGDVGIEPAGLSRDGAGGGGGGGGQQRAAGWHSEAIV